MSWIDPGDIDESIAAQAAAIMGIDIEDECYCDIYNYLDEMSADVMISAEPEAEAIIIDASTAPGEEQEFLELPPQPPLEAPQDDS